jgi:hypothetical protein
MRLVGLLAAFFIVLVGLTGMLAPDCLMTIGRHSVTPVGIYLVAALRIGIGLVLAKVAPVSRAPKALRVLGVIAVLGGVATLFLGTERAQAILEWWSAHGPLFIRMGAGIALVLGGFIAYTLIPGRRAVDPRGGPRSP